MTTTTNDIADHQKILERLANELVSSFTEISDIENRLRAIPAELDRLQKRADSRALTLQKAKDSLEAAQSSLKKQQMLAEMAADTASFATALEPVAELEKAVKAAQSALEAIVQRAEKEEEKDNAKQAELHKQQEQLTGRLRNLQDRRETLKATREEVFQRLGQLTFEEGLKQIESLRTRHADRQSELQKAEEEAEQALSTAARQWRGRLKDWPDLQQRIDQPGGKKPPFWPVSVILTEKYDVPYN